MSGAKLQGKRKLQSELALTDDETFVADVAKADLTKAVEGCTALIIATSATPKPVWSSFPGFFWARFVKQEKVMPKFTYPAMPEQVCCHLPMHAPGQERAEPQVAIATYILPHSNSCIILHEI